MSFIGEETEMATEQISVTFALSSRWWRLCSVMNPLLKSEGENFLPGAMKKIVSMGQGKSEMAF